MSGTIDDLKLRSVSIKESPVPVSLESLILQSQATTLLEDLEIDDTAPDIEEIPMSRKGRRKKIKSSRVVSRRPGEKQKKESTEQKRLEAEFQEKNKKALLDYKLQSKQKNMSVTSKSFMGGLNLLSAQKSEVISKGKVIRPVVLGSVDLDPIYDSTGRSSPAGKLLRLKRSVRRIKLDKIVKPKLNNQEFKGVPLAVALVDYLDAKENFFNSLRPSNISMYQHAINAFELTITKNVSNSEMLYTMLNEYSASLKSGTAKLDESAPRSVDRGTDLIGEKSGKISDLASALKDSGRNAYDNYQTATRDDVEISLKSLIALFTKDVVYSFNTANNAIANNNPHAILRTVRKGDAVQNPRTYNSDSSSLGVLFTSVKNGKAIVNYPFELTDILAEKKETKSASGFVSDLRNDNRTESYDLLPVTKTSKSVNSIYEAVSSNMADATSSLRSLATISDMDIDGSSYIHVYNGLISKIKPRFQEAPTNSAACLEIAVLAAAGARQDFMAWLLIYLAFREQRKSGYNGISKEPASAALIKGNHYLSILAGVLGSNVKVEKSFEVNPQTISLNPGVDGQTNFTAPSTKQSATLQVSPESFEFGTLESQYEVSFEAICDTFAKNIHSYLERQTAPGKSFSGTGMSIYSNQVKNMLLNVDDDNSLFTFALEYTQLIDGLIPKDKDTISIFNDNDRTLFGKIPKRNLHLAYVGIISKLVQIIASGKFSAVKKKQTSSVTSKTKTTVIPKTPSSPQSAGSTPTTYSPVGVATTSFGSAPSITAGSTVGNTLSSPSTSASSIAQAAEMLEHTDVYFESDYTSSLMDLDAYLDSEKQADFSAIIESYPVLSAVGSALFEEDLFLNMFGLSLSNYFSTINRNYEVVSKTLEKVVAGRSLRLRIQQGLEPSADLAKCLQSFSTTLNSPYMTYSGVKTRDTLIGAPSYAHLESQLKQSKYRSKGKVFSIGIPVSLLDQTQTTPSEISEVRTNKRVEKKDNFNIIVQKINQANSEIQYKDKVFSFSRSLFCIGLHQDFMGSPKELSNAGFIKIHDDLHVEELPLESAIKLYPKDVVENHTTDLVLKQYIDLQMDIDFSEYSFPSAPAAKKNSLSSNVDISCFASVGAGTKKFLSGSNLAFDPKNRQIQNFEFYKASPESPSLINIDMSSPTKNDNYTFSAFDYVNCYGSIFIPDLEEKRLADGVDFEKVICLLIDDDDFEIELKDDKESSSTNSEINSMLTAQETQGLGVTSNGVDLNTYRFLISFDDGSE